MRGANTRGEKAGDALLESDGEQLEVPLVAVYMVYLTMFVDTLAASISTPVLPYYARSFNVPVSYIGYLYFAWNVTSTVFAPWAGRLSDKIGRRPVLIGSLVGAGIANLGQGVCPHLVPVAAQYWVFLFFRALSGAFAAVGSTCNVYLADVVPEKKRTEYLSKMSAVPMVAILFGPGLGGGLSKFGLNVPIMVDAVISLFSACVVFFNLPETPAYIRSKLQATVVQKATTRRLSGDVEQASSEEKKQEGRKGFLASLSCTVWMVGISMLLGAVNMSVLISCFAVFAKAFFQFDALDVGFTFSANSLVMIASNVWIASRLVKLTGSEHGAAAVGGVLNGVCCILWSNYFVYGLDWKVLMFPFLLGTVGMATRSSMLTPILAKCTDEGNRGSVFGFAQLLQNSGRAVGSIIATNLSDLGMRTWGDQGAGLPFWVGGTVTILSAFLLLGIRTTPKDSGKKELQRSATTFGEEWQDEIGTDKDKKQLGEFVANLLTKRHYKWVTQRERVLGLLEQHLPELSVECREQYNKSFDAAFNKDALDSRSHVAG